MFALALYQPDIPQNVGSLLRLAACMNIPAHIIEPCGFVFDDKRMRRSGMDYLDHVTLTRHPSWEAFESNRKQSGKRLVLLTTKTHTSYMEFDFQPGDILLLGRESAGVPDEVRQASEAQVRIPISGHTRSLNMAMAGAMVLGEALRQANGFPTL